MNIDDLTAQVTQRRGNHAIRVHTRRGRGAFAGDGDCSHLDIFPKYLTERAAQQLNIGSQLHLLFEHFHLKAQR